MPAQIDDAAFAQAGVLDPLQHLAGTPPVVAEEPSVPTQRNPEPCHHANENETRHSPASCKKSYFLSMHLRKWGEKEKSTFQGTAIDSGSLIGER
jgi:hypothetical protein